MLLLFMSSLFNVAWNILASAHGVIGHLKVRQEYSDYLSLLLSPALALKPQWNPNFPSKKILLFSAPKPSSKQEDRTNSRPGFIMLQLSVKTYLLYQIQ